MNYLPTQSPTHPSLRLYQKNSYNSVVMQFRNIPYSHVIENPSLKSAFLVVATFIYTWGMCLSRVNAVLISKIKKILNWYSKHKDLKCKSNYEELGKNWIDSEIFACRILGYDFVSLVHYGNSCVNTRISQNNFQI